MGNNLFPVFVKLESLQTLIVGGGYVGLEKLSALLKSAPTARITLVAREISSDIRTFAADYLNVTLVERNFRLWDVWNKDLVFLATDDRRLHESIREFTRTRNLLINVADTPDLCDFYLGSVITKGHLKIGISTNGKSPTLAKRMREYLEEAIPDDTDQLLDNMESIREQIKGDFSHKVKVLNDITASWLESKK